VNPVPSAGQVLVVTGEAGMGKTVLLADAADWARLAGLRVLSVTGRESESRLAFAGLHQLLRPALAPAEELGLVRVDRTGLQFSHPLVRSAIYHSAPFAQRAAAHRQLAGALHDQPHRRAWHLAAATLQPDEQVASLLEATATQAQRRGGAAAAALAMERAAELSPEPEDQARRLVAAASAAVPAGQADWVQDLATRALAVTADPGLRLAARRDAG
jgi:hypothetical protein